MCCQRVVPPMRDKYLALRRKSSASVSVSVSVFLHFALPRSHDFGRPESTDRNQRVERVYGFSMPLVSLQLAFQLADNVPWKRSASLDFSWCNASRLQSYRAPTNTANANFVEACQRWNRICELRVRIQWQRYELWRKRVWRNIGQFLARKSDFTNFTDWKTQRIERRSKALERIRWQWYELWRESVCRDIGQFYGQKSNAVGLRSILRNI